jgi:hypothetical protein
VLSLLTWHQYKQPATIMGRNQIGELTGAYNDKNVRFLYSILSLLQSCLTAL